MIFSRTDMHTPHPNLSGLSAPTPILLGGAPYHRTEDDVRGEHVMVGGEPYVCIHNVDALEPFFMSIVSNNDLWTFVGSNTAFTAGRSHPDSAIFPYQTVDKILQHPNSAGAMTILLVRRGAKDWTLWEPWRPSGYAYKITRNVYKHAHGSVVIFEEINHDLGLRLRWSLTASEEFGLVRSCELKNLLPGTATVKYLDGWHHLLPVGVNQDMYARISYLAAAYMRHERRPDSVLGIYTLNSRITDRAEPAESLRASCAWSLGHAQPTVLLCERQVKAFCHNAELTAETEVRGEFGAYLVADQIELSGGHDHRWTTVADTGLDHSALIALEKKLAAPEKLQAALVESVSANIRGLRERIASADGLQDTADRSASVHHFANVLFNCMRGGTFSDSQTFPCGDFAKFLKSRNATIHAHHQEWLNALPAEMTLVELSQAAAKQADPHLNRLAREYLPLTFSRRHGDPSRPWNRFMIRVKNEQGEGVYDYQGNWRDIFQNWESLAHSYPSALDRMIAVFLNASTADGYNPYRVTRAGIDWEVLDHEDPWSHIGYWGDHQLIYLLRLLQACDKHYPGKLASQLSEKLYAYAVVPYEISGFDDLLRDPNNSIHFNEALHDRLVAQAEKIGNDGKLLADDNGEIALVSLAEKLLVPLLTKLSNLVPGGGIWMNTQRPDWNDANNALVGWGLSMVTVYQMRQYIGFVDNLFEASERPSLEISASVADFIAAIEPILSQAAKASSFTDEERYVLIETLGRAGERHRRTVYGGRFPSSATIPVQAIRELLANALKVTDTTIRANRREDGMYHSYNLLDIRNKKASVRPLQLMLEGQVGLLSSKFLSPDEALSLLRALRASDLYRPDQHSYMLYPDKVIEPFLSRNTLPKDWTTRAPLLLDLVASGCSDVVVLDENGAAHFQADLTNVGDLGVRLDRHAKNPTWEKSVARDRDAVKQLWEEVFDHSTFLGRSGTMFAFEGLGSIYWHMVAKLLLAVQENHQHAFETDAKPEVIRALGEVYYDVRKGLGFTKTPEVYGAFPTDPYSHSPGHRGAQQPGMTGQVKEEILTRWGELGVHVADGCIRFEPRLLHAGEFFAEPHLFTYSTIDGTESTWNLPAGSLGFTYCQIPICYHLADSASIMLESREGSTRINGHTLPSTLSAEIFSRDRTIFRILVEIPRTKLLD
jgi:hypothetical protein